MGGGIALTTAGGPVLGGWLTELPVRESRSNHAATLSL